MTKRVRLLSMFFIFFHASYAAEIKETYCPTPESLANFSFNDENQGLWIYDPNTNSPATKTQQESRAQGTLMYARKIKGYKLKDTIVFLKATISKEEAFGNQLTCTYEFSESGQTITFSSQPPGYKGLNEKKFQVPQTVSNWSTAHGERCMQGKAEVCLIQVGTNPSTSCPTVETVNKKLTVDEDKKLWTMQAPSLEDVTLYAVIAKEKQTTNRLDFRGIINGFKQVAIYNKGHILECTYTVNTNAPWAKKLVLFTYPPQYEAHIELYRVSKNSIRPWNNKNECYGDKLSNRGAKDCSFIIYDMSRDVDPAIWLNPTK